MRWPARLWWPEDIVIWFSEFFSASASVCLVSSAMVCNKVRSRSCVFSFSFFTFFLLHSFSFPCLLTLFCGLFIGSMVEKLFISYFVSMCFFCGYMLDSLFLFCPAYSFTILCMFVSLYSFFSLQCLWFVFICLFLRVFPAVFYLLFPGGIGTETLSGKSLFCFRLFSALDRLLI